ncbi:MAG: caspase family protein, partial [Nitrospinota bacterium]
VTAYNHNNEVASPPVIRKLTVTSPFPIVSQAPPSQVPSAQTNPPIKTGKPEKGSQPQSTTSTTTPPQEPPASKPPTVASQSSQAPPTSSSTATQTPEQAQPEQQKPEVRPRRPALYVLAIGINRYRDRALWLKYAVPDAQAITARIREIGEPLFPDIRVTELFDDQATFAGIDAAFQRIASQAQTKDVFVLYMAGHGKTLDGRYYFLPQDFRYRNEDSIRREAINQDHLQRWLASIPARKSLVLIDTCESGSFTQSLALLRGMVEKTAIEKLIRATGRATIVAATDVQPALEGYRGHGVFTYVLLEALQQADKNFGNRDGITSIFELAQYVDDRVPEVTLQAFQFEQFPQVYMLGSDFPIGLAQRN